MHNRHIKITGDNSKTIVLTDTQISYHSTFGAVQESMHVFIECGLKYFLNTFPKSGIDGINVFEMGLGTGLNALLTWNEVQIQQQKIIYHVVELYPLNNKEIEELNYDDYALTKKISLSKIHSATWNELVEFDEYFSFIKYNEDVKQFDSSTQFNIIYFDAFDPNFQAELWTESVFKKMFDMLQSNGILVTYCSKGTVRRAMQAAGFKIQKLKGPKGKREIVRAMK